MKDDVSTGVQGDQHTDHRSDHRGDPGVDLQVDLHAGESPDLGRDLASEPESDEVEVWFEAEELARASTVELELGTAVEAERGRGLLQPAPEVEELLDGLAGPSLSLASLPGWPDAEACGQGLGEAASLLGELRPGQLVLWTSARRGSGRSTLLAQLADGLALREGPEQPLTPVLCISDRPAWVWRARSLARWSGLELETFVDPGRARQHAGLRERLDHFANGERSALADRQRFVDLGRFASEPEPVLDALRRWRAAFGDRIVWPVVVVDPLEAVEGRGDRLAMLDALVTLAQHEQLIVLASCDAPPSSDARELDRRAHARFDLQLEGDHLQLELLHSPLGRRGRARLRFDGRCGRVSPASTSE